MSIERLHIILFNNVIESDINCQSGLSYAKKGDDEESFNECCERTEIARLPENGRVGAVTLPSGGPLRAVVRRPLLRRLLRPVAAFGAVVGVGVFGFSSLGGVGAIDALFWLLDPTSIELHFRTHEGPETLVKGYAVVVLSGLVVAGLWIGETVFSAAFGGQIRMELKEMGIERSIEELQGHIIICGYGTFGKTIAQSLRETDRDVVVIEQEDAEFQRALDDDLLAVQGDARREETLTDAGVKRAATVVGAIDDSNANIQIAMAASGSAPTVRLVVRVGDGMYEALARRAGADEVIIPEVASAEQVTTTL